jgi:hypothetical protein
MLCTPLCSTRSPEVPLETHSQAAGPQRIGKAQTNHRRTVSTMKWALGHANSIETGCVYSLHSTLRSEILASTISIKIQPDMMRVHVLSLT